MGYASLEYHAPGSDSGRGRRNQKAATSADSWRVCFEVSSYRLEAPDGGVRVYNQRAEAECVPCSAAVGKTSCIVYNPIAEHRASREQGSGAQSLETRRMV